MPPSLWVFLPTYNEAGNLEEVVRATAAQLEQTAPGDWRVLVVDDASPDGTGVLADRLADQLAGVEVLHRPGKQGLGPAYLAGFQHALARGAEYVVVMDADFSHDPAHLPALVAAAENSDLVLGSRYVAGGEIADWPWLRRLLSRFGSLYARTILGVRVNDLTSGYRLVRRRVLETVEPSTLRAQGYVFNIELTYRTLLAGFTVAEVPIRFRDRKAGESKMSLPIAFEALMLVPKLRTSRPPPRGRTSGARDFTHRQRLRITQPRWPRRRGGLLPDGSLAGEAGGDPRASADNGAAPNEDSSRRAPSRT